MNRNIEENLSEDICCGCGACVQACPRQCIIMEENNRGFLMPRIDKNLCVNCGYCIKVCPEKEVPSLHSVQSAFAAVVDNLKLLKRSTSGGIFGILAEHFLEEKGHVFGCAWNGELICEHICITRKDELHRIQQSKYVQSNTLNTYCQAKEALDEGKKILYSGTACQIAGLRKYLKTEYMGLYTVEVACHGVPSPGLFKRYIQWLEEKENSDVIGFNFRNKVKHSTGEHYMFQVTFSNGMDKFYMSKEDPYYGSFLEGRTLRSTCYKCKYKGQVRVSDITLSDFWGIEKELPDFPARNGASAILINTEKGKQLMEKIISECTTKKTSFDKIVKHNQSMVKCIEYPIEKRLFELGEDNQLLFSSLKPAFCLKNRLKDMVPGRVKYFLKRII